MDFYDGFFTLYLEKYALHIPINPVTVSRILFNIIYLHERGQVCMVGRKGNSELVHQGYEGAPFLHRVWTLSDRITSINPLAF